MRKKYFIWLTIILLLCISSFIYSINTNYYLSGDLPNNINYIKTLGDMTNISPIFSEDYIPDIHEGIYPVTLNIFYLTGIFPNNLSSEIFSGEVYPYVFILNFMGALIALLLPLSFFIFTRKYFNKNLPALVSSTILFLMIELPLIRWSGIISIQGLMTTSSYAQTFALAMSFFCLFIYLKMKEKKSIPLLILFLFLYAIAFLSHMLMGLILLSILIFSVSYNFFRSKDKFWIIVLLTLILDFLILFLWPLFPVYSALSSMISFKLLILFFCLIIPFTWICSKYLNKNLINSNSQNLRYLTTRGIIVMLIVFLTILSLLTSEKISAYGSASNPSSWIVSFLLFFIPAILFSLHFIKLNKDSLSLAFVAWFYGSILIFLLGSFGFPFKIFSRFLFLAKIPASIILGFFIAKIFNKENKKYVATFFFILIVGLYFSLILINSSNQAIYFKKVPQEFYIAKEVQGLINNSLILSDPFTSYYIGSLTNNRVIAVSKDRVSDYNFNKNLDNLNLSYELLKNQLCEKLNKLEIKGIVLNKFIKFNSNLDYSNQKIESPSIDRLEKCGFRNQYEDNYSIILIK